MYCDCFIFCFHVTLNSNLPKCLTELRAIFLLNCFGKRKHFPLYNFEEDFIPSSKEFTRNIKYPSIFGGLQSIAVEEKEMEMMGKNDIENELR